MSFLGYRGVLNKDYKPWMMEQSEAITAAAQRYALENGTQGVEPIRWGGVDKEQLARARQRQRGLKQGLIGVWSCLEACRSYKACFDAQAGYPQLRAYDTRCKHLYFYFDQEDYGFMSVRLQTWFPYGIQIALNGREWLRRSLDKRGLGYVLAGNKFLHLDHVGVAQKLLSAQVHVRWDKLLRRFLPLCFPTLKQTLGPYLSYYWTLWQSEWATDYMFDRTADLKPIMDTLLRHALMTGTSARVLRYLGRPLAAAGLPYAQSHPQVITRVSAWHDGVRIRHWVDENSAKLYNEHNILRVEATFNNPSMFQVYRYAEGHKGGGAKKRMPMRKGIADIPLRARVASDVNRRVMDQVATFQDDTPLRDVLGQITRPRTENGRRSRALDITGKDREFLQAIADPCYAVSGITNKRLQKQLRGSPWAKGGTDRKLSARITRHLSLLRAHGLLRKMPNQRRYVLTDQGRLLTSALNALLAASTQQLMEIAA